MHRVQLVKIIYVSLKWDAFLSLLYRDQSAQIGTVGSSNL